MTEPDYDIGKCDKCGEEFHNEDLYAHDDGNTYCSDCCYLTKQDRIDGEADDALGDL